MISKNQNSVFQLESLMTQEQGRVVMFQILHKTVNIPTTAKTLRLKFKRVVLQRVQEHILTLSFVLRVKLMSETRSKETLQKIADVYNKTSCCIMT